MQSTAKPDSPFLDHLPPHTNTYVYQSLEQFASVISAEAERLQQGRGRSQFLVFTHVPNDIVERDEKEQEIDITRYTLDTYTAHDGLLIIKMTSAPHEAAHDAIRNVLLGKLSGMSHADRDLRGRGRKTIKGNRRAKEADLSYIPLRRPPGRSGCWPTLALESGYTDSQARLTTNAEWWLNASNGDTNIAMTVDIDKTSRRITIKKYQYSETGDLHEESVTVQKPDNYNSNTQVVGAPLIIPFEKLFLRAPVANEGDIVWKEDDLTYIAEAVWAEQGF